MFVIEDAAADERFRDNPLVTDDPKIRFYAGYPLPGPHGHRLGTLCIIDREPRTLSEGDLQSLSDIGEMVANELAALQLASVDELTGLSNRRGFASLVRQALGFCLRVQQPVTLVALDMDGFKAINDDHGHEEGDRALREFAQLLLTTARESDIIARMGGDEFCVLLTGATETQAHLVVSRLREAVAKRNAGSPTGYSLAFSVGVSEFQPQYHLGIEDLLREADARMYNRKRSKARRTGRTGVGPD